MKAILSNQKGKINIKDSLLHERSHLACRENNATP